MSETQSDKELIEESETLNEDNVRKTIDEILTLLAKGAEIPNKELNFEKKRDLTNEFEILNGTLNDIRITSGASKAVLPIKLVRKILSSWDLIILCFLNLVFVTYLSFFLSAYYAPKSDFSLEFNNKINLLYNWGISNWMSYKKIEDFSKEECAIYSPDYLNSITRPINKCKMCEGLNEIKRIENVTKEEFLSKYAYSSVPVIITDALRNWTAMQVVNFEFLKGLYLDSDDKGYRDRQSRIDIHKNDSPLSDTINSIIETDEERSKLKDTCQFFPYKTKFKNLRQVFEMNSQQKNPWYVGWSNCNSYAGLMLRKHYDRPYFLPDESEMSRLDWIFMGTPGYGAGIHIDDVNNPSWQAQITGIKRWTFRPPAECLLKCKFNLYADVHPGEIIIFDSNDWFHSTYIIGDQISLTIGSEYD